MHFGTCPHSVGFERLHNFWGIGVVWFVGNPSLNGVRSVHDLQPNPPEQLPANPKPESTANTALS